MFTLFKLGRALPCLVLLVICSWPVAALDITYGELAADLRLRSEVVEQDNALRDARANTLALDLSFVTNTWHNFRLGMQGEAVKSLTSERYNSGPGGNGRSTFSVVPDPEGEEVNQLWLAYDGLANTKIKLGRQRLIFDNARFVGNVGWRQNEQSYDGLTIVNKSVEMMTLQYAYLKEVHNIFFQDQAFDASHLLNIRYDLGQHHALTGYAYLLDYAVGVGSDQRTLGLSAQGQLWETASLSSQYRLEYARQTEYADAPAHFDVDYSLIELGLLWQGNAFKFGLETLGSDGDKAFTTPLATLHAFNGWADVFLKTPDSGLVDRYMGFSRKLAGFKVSLIYHDLVGDRDGVQHGVEWDAAVAYAPVEDWSFLVKLADYKAEDTAVDTRKMWFQAAYHFD